eukprot:Nitzschia sp. Nitz4//scaffold73_size107353//45176//46328//NITZ4_004316-RA/size107353-snap-gene-0.102-mRNA-1//-1//CDS//3329557464//4686//frame0
MTDYVNMSTAAKLAVQSSAAGASLSMADANFDGVKHHDPSKVSWNNQLWTSFVGIFAVLAVSTSLVAMWWEASIYAYVAFAFPLMTGPYVLIQRRRIQWLPTFREEANKLRMSVNDMAAQNVRLNIENSRLDRQVQRLRPVQERFDQLVIRDNKNIQELRQVVRENAAVLKEIKKTQASGDLLDLLSIVLSSDRDENAILSDEEWNRLLARLRVFADRRNQHLDEEALRMALRQTPSERHSAGSTFNVIQQALSQEEKEESGEATTTTTTRTRSTLSRGGDIEMGTRTASAQPAPVPRLGATGLAILENTSMEGNPSNPIRIDSSFPEEDAIPSAQPRRVKKQTMPTVSNWLTSWL